MNLLNMRLHLLAILLFLATSLPAQVRDRNYPSIAEIGNRRPGYTWIAPGELYTIYLVDPDPANNGISVADTPLDSAARNIFGGVGVGHGLPLSEQPAIIRVRKFRSCYTARLAPFICTDRVAITVQAAFNAGQFGADNLAVGLPGQPNSSDYIAFRIVPSNIRFLSPCDDLFEPVTEAWGFPRQFCEPVATHLDGTPITARAPAKAGEIISLYATGMGNVVPALRAGQRPTVSSPTVEKYHLAFDFLPNASGREPLEDGVEPLYTGSVVGYIGLYQINLRVPEIPKSIRPCDLNPQREQGSTWSKVRSNLTISVAPVSGFKFDALGICVQQ